MVMRDPTRGTFVPAQRIVRAHAGDTNSSQIPKVVREQLVAVK